MIDKKVNKRKLNKGVSIPVPEGPYSSLQVGGPDPSWVLELEEQEEQVLLHRVQ